MTKPTVVDVRQGARYSWADGDTILLDVEREPLLTNLVDTLAEHPALLRALTGAVFASGPYDAISGPRDGLTTFATEYRRRQRADYLTVLVASDELAATLTHCLDEDQANDLSLELDHAIRQVSVAPEYDPFERDQTYKED